MADQASNVVLNFKMNGQVQYAQTLKQINMVMQTASKEYTSQITAMGKDASMTEKLVAEKKKLDTQLTASAKKVEMLTKEFEDMQNDTNATADDLQKLYNQLLSAETAHAKLEQSMQRVKEGLTDEAIAARDAKAEYGNLASEMQVLEAEQKSLTSTFNLQNRELGANATEAEKNALAQRQLAQQMELTERVVGTLERQLEEAKKAYGENSREVHQLEAKLNQAKSEVTKFNREVAEVEDNAEKAERGLDGLSSGLAALAGAVPAAAIGALVSETEELATELARLQSNADAWGFSADIVEDSFQKLTSVTGDTGAAVETISNLMSTAFSDEQLVEAIDHITGAYIQFSDTLSAEGIADGLQETFAVGEAAGAFAELLERSGLVLDDFNAGLGEAIKNGTETDYVLQTLSSTGVKSFYENYKEMNSELVAVKEAEVEHQMALKELGDVFRPIITQVTEFTTSLIQWATENDKLVLGIGIASVAIGGIIAVLAIISPIITAITSVMGAITVSFAAVVAPIAIAVAAIAGLAAIFVVLYKNSETFRNTIHEVFEAVKTTIQTVMDYVAAYLQEKLATIRAFWDENGAQIQQAFENVFNGIKAVVEFVMPAIQFLIEGVVSAIKNVIDGGLQVIMGIIKTFASIFTGDISGMWEGIKQLFSGAIELIWGIVQLGFVGKIFKVVESFGKLVKGKFDEIGQAMLAPITKAKDKISEAIDAIKGFFSHLDIKFPEIKMPKLPKFSIKGEFSLNPPSVPTLGIDWFAKGGIMTRPTAFGMNGNRIMAGGEAGPEAILPLNEKTLGEIGKMIATTMKPSEGHTFQIYTQEPVEKVIRRELERMAYRRY